jgi:hypothetical protein
VLVVVMVVVVMTVVVVVVVVVVASINLHRLVKSKSAILGHSEMNYLKSKDHRQNGEGCWKKKLAGLNSAVRN